MLTSIFFLASLTRLTLAYTPASIDTQSCTTPPATTATSCTTWHVEDAAAGYPITSSCMTVVATPSPVCTFTTNPTVAATPTVSTWSDWSESVSVTKSSTSSCTTPAASDITSCSTWHIETAGYPITSSCTTFKATPTPVCAISAGVSAKPVSGSVTTITTSSCTTPAASTTTTCSTFHLEGTTAFPVTSSCSTWHIETAGYPITSSCTTYHLEATATFPVTSSCAVVTATPLPVCAVITKVVTISSSDSADWSVWASSTGAKVPADATGTGLIAKYTGAASANAASFVIVGAAAVAAVMLA